MEVTKAELQGAEDCSKIATAHKTELIVGNEVANVEYYFENIESYGVSLTF